MKVDFRLLGIVVVLLAASVPAHLFGMDQSRSPTDDTVSTIIQNWAAVFNKLDAQALAALYSKSAFFFGSNASLYRGREGVAAYFDALPRWNSPTVQFSDLNIAAVGPDVINVAGTASFFIGEDAPRTVKIIWIIVREDGDWKIVGHHVSSMTPLIAR